MDNRRAMGSTGNREIRWSRDIFVLGVTGTPGSGKSTVSRILAEAGAFVIDADIEAREILESPETAPVLIKVFGRDIMNQDGKPDRQKIAETVFTDSRRLQELNALIHPRVRDRFRQKASTLQPGTVIVYDVPLLFESEMESLCDWVISVSAPESLRLERVNQRGWSESEFRRRAITQMSDREKDERADQIITNDGDLAGLRKRLQSLYRNIIEARGN